MYVRINLPFVLHLFDFSTFLHLKGFNLEKKHYVCNQKKR